MLVPTYTVLSFNTIKKKSITPCIIIIQWMVNDGSGRGGAEKHCPMILKYNGWDRVAGAGQERFGLSS